MQKLFELVEKKEIDVVLIEHKDRLSRFCFNYLLSYFNSYGVRIEKVEEVMSKSFENELVEDILSLMASFSAKIYERYSSQNRKKERKGEIRMKQEIWLGDCLELMNNIPDKSVDMILCDLPYGAISCAWDVIIPFDKLWEQYNRICKSNAAVVLFASQPFTTDLICSNRKNFKYPLVWSKNVPTGMSVAKYRPMKYHEDILVFHREQPTYNPIMKERVGVGKACYNYDHYCGESNHVKLDKIKKKYDPNFVQPSSVLDFKTVPNRNGKLHPTQKPVELCEYLIKTYTNENDLVLDNCAGSGSTLVAAKNLNRQFIGIEKEKEYYDICLERLK